MTRILKLLILIVIIAVQARAQNYTFRVLTNKGLNEVKLAGKWQPIRTGVMLNIGDEIKITENASVALVHRSGNALEEKKAGVYKIEDLEKRIKSTPTVLNKYTDFMLSKNTEEKNRMVATGAVHRGNDDIKLQLPESQNSELFNNTIYVGWESNSTGPFTVKFVNTFDDELIKIETRDKMVKVDMNDPRLKGDSLILVSVKLKSSSKNPDPKAIRKISKANYNTINKSLLELKKEFNPEFAELNKLMLAAFYEQNKLFIDAIASYEDLIKMDPENDSFRELYDNFLYRNNLKDPK